MYNLQHLGRIEEKNNNLDKAYNYYKTAFSQSYTTKNVTNISILISTRMADILIQKQNPKTAILLLEHVESEKINKETPEIKNILNQQYIEFYEKLAKAHELNKNYKKAYYYNKRHIAAIKAVNSVNVIKNTSELEKKYQTKIDQQEIKLLKDENEIKQRNLFITLLSLGAIALLLIFSYAYYMLRSKALKRKSKLAELALEAEKNKAEKLENEKRITNLELELKQRELTTNSISLLQKKDSLMVWQKL